MISKTTRKHSGPALVRQNIRLARQLGVGERAVQQLRQLTYLSHAVAQFAR